MASLEQRFWAKVRKTDGCWLWAASTSFWGYGCFSFRRRFKLAHRVSWELHNGVIPEGLCVLHKCDTPKCVNPDHLFLGTNADNSADKVAKGRQSHTSNAGEASGRAKLTSVQVLEIRSRPDCKGVDLAKAFGVCQAQISLIRHGKTWAHI